MRTRRIRSLTVGGFSVGVRHLRRESGDVLRLEFPEPLSGRAPRAFGFLELPGRQWTREQLAAVVHFGLQAFGEGGEHARKEMRDRFCGLLKLVAPVDLENLENLERRLERIEDKLDPK